MKYAESGVLFDPCLFRLKYLKKSWDGGAGNYCTNVACHPWPIWTNTFSNSDKCIWQLRQIHLGNTSRNLGLVRKGRFCTMLHVTVGHYRHSGQATSHPKAMRQPHRTILSKSFFHNPASVHDCLEKSNDTYC